MGFTGELNLGLTENSYHFLLEDKICVFEWIDKLCRSFRRRNIAILLLLYLIN